MGLNLNGLLLMGYFLSICSTLEQRETLLVVATLIATLTFTGVLQPPGAFRSEDSNGGSGSQNNNNNRLINTIFGSEGQAIMANSPVNFTLYAAFNAVGFLVSVTMISLLTKGFPMRNWIRLCMHYLNCCYLSDCNRLYIIK